jgi:putative ABC transport system permease protein
MKTVDFFAIAAKDLRRQFVRSTLTIIALIISTTILVIMAAISIGGRQAIIDQYGSDMALATITVTPNQSGNTLSLFGDVQEVNTQTAKLDDTTAARLRQVPHVASVSPRAFIWEMHHFSIEGSEKQFVAQANGLSDGTGVALKAGSLFSSEATDKVAVIGASYAKELGVEPGELVGKSITFTTQKGYRGVGAAIPAAGAGQQANEAFNQVETQLKATIVGVTDTGPNQNALFIPMAWAREIRTARYNDSAGLKTVDQLTGDGYSTILVSADSSANVKSVSSAIARLGYSQISTLSQIERLQQFTTMMWVILGAVALVAIIAAALGVANTMLMAVSEQRYTIGVWRAVGARRKVIVRIFLIQAGLLGMIGGVFGVILGVIACRYINEYTHSLLVSQGLALTSIALTPAWLLFGTVILTTLFGIVAGIYPAYRAAKQDPSTALSSGQ